MLYGNGCLVYELNNFFLCILFQIGRHVSSPTTWIWMRVASCFVSPLAVTALRETIRRLPTRTSSLLERNSSTLTLYYRWEFLLNRLVTLTERGSLLSLFQCCICFQSSQSRQRRGEEHRGNRPVLKSPWQLHPCQETLHLEVQSLCSNTLAYRVQPYLLNSLMRSWSNAGFRVAETRHQRLVQRLFDHCLQFPCSHFLNLKLSYSCNHLFYIFATVFDVMISEIGKCLVFECSCNYCWVRCTFLGQCCFPGKY